MNPASNRERRLSTGLKVFIVVSILLHLTVAVSLVIPYFVRQVMEQRRLAAEQQAREEARRRAEAAAAEAVREIAGEKVVAQLEQDARGMLSEFVDEKEFEAIWDDVLKDLGDDIDGLLAELEAKDFQIDPAELEAMLQDIRTKELEAILAKINATSKADIAARILESLRRSLPEFNKKVEEQLARDGERTAAQMEQLFKTEQAKREAERQEAAKELEQAAREVKQAQENAKKMEESAKRTDEALNREQALQKAAAAMTAAVASLEKAKGEAAELKADAKTIESKPGKVPRDDKQERAEAGQALEQAAQAAREAKAAVSKAVAAAEKTGNREAKAALKEAAHSTANAAEAALKEATAQLAANKPKAAAAEAAKASSAAEQAATESEKTVNALAKTAAAEKDRAQYKALDEAVQTMDTARKSFAKAAAESKRAAAMAAAISQKDEMAAAKEADPAAVAAAQRAHLGKKDQAIRAAVEKAGAALKESANDKEVASETAARSAVEQAAQRAQAETAGPLRALKEAVESGVPARAVEKAADAETKLGTLIAEMKKTRDQLAAGKSSPQNAKAEQDKTAAEAAALDEALRKTDDRLRAAAGKAKAASEPEIGENIAKTAEEARGVKQETAAETAAILKPSATGAASRKNAAALQQVAENAERKLGEIGASIEKQKSALAKGGEKFDSEAKQALEQAASADSGVRAKAGALAEQAIREKVAEEFRPRVEDIAAQALQQNDMGKDDRFVKAVGQQAVELLLGGETKPMRDGAFDKLMARSMAQKNAGAKKETGAKTGGPLQEQVAKAAAQAAESSIPSAMQAGQPALQLPSLTVFGAAGSGLNKRILNAMSGKERQGGALSQSMALVDLSRDMGRLASAAKSPRRQYTLFQGSEVNAKKYQENIAEVIAERAVDEHPLKAAAIAEAKSVAGYTLRTNRIAAILVAPPDEAPAAASNGAPAAARVLEQPNFKSFAYGGAVMATNEPVIDGDLAEWAAVEKFALRGKVKTANWRQPFPPEWEGNRNLLVQWNKKGFYFAYRMVDDKDNIGANQNEFWANDSLELWFDFANKRSDKRTRDTQQLWFWPVGSALGPEVIGGEAVVSPTEFKMNPSFRRNGGPDKPRMAVKRVAQPLGYQVEIFLPAAVFAKPDLRPGRIIAFNFSTHNGRSCYLRWTTNLGQQESVTPSLWGDLILLGADAAIGFVKPGTEDPLTVITPGEPVGIRVADQDMNLDSAAQEKIEVTVSAQNGSLVRGYLEETGKDTGIFEGSLDTEQLAFTAAAGATNNVLQVAGGEMMEVTYLDQARRYGERNHQAKASLPVGIPVLNLSAK